MGTFRVKTEWFGYAPGTHYIVAQSTTYKRFLTTEYVYDLDISTAKVDLAGPGTDQIDDTNDEIITKAPSFYIGNTGIYLVWFSLSEVANRFDGKAEGWRVRAVDCPIEETSIGETGEGEGEGEGEEGETFIITDDPVAPSGIEVRFKGHIDSGTISTSFAAPTAKITVRGQEITVPVGPSTTTASGGAAKDCTGKYRLCPDGNGDYTVAEIEQEPTSDTVVLVQNIKLKQWTHVK